jgi:benzoyl-CoA reductase subunit BamB
MPILAGLGSPQEMLHADEKWHTENFMWGNARVRRKDFWNKEIEEKWKNSLETVRTRLISCYNCPMKCGAIISAPGISTYMMKCFTKLTYTMAAFVDDLDFGFKIAQRATEYGVDGFSMPQAMAFAFELKEAGILTDSDFAGCPSDTRGDFTGCLTGLSGVKESAMYWPTARIGPPRRSDAGPRSMSSPKTTPMSSKPLSWGAGSLTRTG